MFESFTQNYTPIGNVYVSAIFAAIPVIIILVMLGVLRTQAHWAALAGLVSSLLLAILFYAMPVGLALSSAVLGALFGLWPIVWIVINALFLHNLTAGYRRSSSPSPSAPFWRASPGSGRRWR